MHESLNVGVAISQQSKNGRYSILEDSKSPLCADVKIRNIFSFKIGLGLHYGCVEACALAFNFQTMKESS